MNEIGKQWCLVKIDYIVPGAKPDYVIMQNDQINQLFAGLMMKDGQPVEYSTNDPHVHFAAQVVEQIEAPDADMFRLKSAMYPETTWNVDIHNDQVMRAYIVMANIEVDPHGYIQKA